MYFIVLRKGIFLKPFQGVTGSALKCPWTRFCEVGKVIGSPKKFEIFSGINITLLIVLFDGLTNASNVPEELSNGNARPFGIERKQFSAYCLRFAACPSPALWIAN